MIKEIQFIKDTDKTPARTLMFLRAVTSVPGIYEALVASGYSQEEHDFAWEKLMSIGGYKVKIGNDNNTSSAGEAMIALDNEDESLLSRSEAVLQRHHPEQAAFVFENVSPGKGADSVIAVGTFLTRLDALESDPAREATRAEDHAALAKLSERGIDKPERERLAGLVKRARVVSDPPKPVEVSEEQRAKDIEELRKWLQDWSQTARAVIKRRDYLIQLGLTKRKTRKKDEETIPATQPAPVPAFPAAPAPAVATNGVPTPAFAPTV